MGLQRLSISGRLVTLVSMLMVLALAATVVGMLGMRAAEDQLREVHEERVIPMASLHDVHARTQADRLAMLDAGWRIASAAPMRFGEVKARVEANQAEIESRWKRFRASVRTEAEHALVAGYEAARAAYVREGLLPALAILDRYDLDGFTAVQEKSAAHYAALERSLGTLIDHHTRAAGEEHEAARARHAWMHALLTGAMVIGFAAALVLAFGIVRGIARPVARLEAAMGEAQASLDLTCAVKVGSRDELGRIAQAYNALVGEFRDALARVSATVAELRADASRVAEGAAKVASASTRQGESTVATARAVEDLTASVNRIAEHAQETRRLAETANRESGRGSGLAAEASAEMQAIAAAVTQASALIARLNARSGEIGGIVSVIKDISDQTNLLALNAAIEAARAGEQGRGFAVVADEVRKLAERTGTSTGEIARMIEEVQQEVVAVVAKLDEGSQRVASGVALADQLAGALGEINTGAHRALGRVSDIAAAASRQGTAGGDIASNIERIAQMSEENAAAVADTSAAAAHVEELAVRLASEVGRFRL